MKQAPEYDWACQNCNQANTSGSSDCQGCACPAQFTLRDLTIPRRPAPNDPLLPAKKNHEPAWLFFPELVIAAGALLYAPIWAVKALAAGKTFAGLLTLIFEAAAVAGFIATWKQQRWLAWLIIACFATIFILL